MIQTLENEFISVNHCVARLIRENPLYQRNADNDEPWLVEEVRKHMGWVKASTICRFARKVRLAREKWQNQ